MSPLDGVAHHHLRMKKQNKFKRDLAFGHEAEVEFARKICKGTKLQPMYNDTGAYDLQVGPFKYEVKSDRMFPQTGNLVVEFACFGKPSGILTSKANYYVYKLNEEFFIISVKDLKKLINKKRYERIVAGGDRHASFMYLFSWPKIMGEFMSVSEFKRLL